MSSPTQRTLQLLRREGYLAAVAEKWNPHSRTRSDLFGFADVLAVRAGAPVLAVQATSASNHSARVRKAQALPQLRTWLSAGCAFEVWSWAKRKGRWRCRRLAGACVRAGKCRGGQEHAPSRRGVCGSGRGPTAPSGPSSRCPSSAGTPHGYTSGR